MLGLQSAYSEVQAQASVSFPLSLSCFPLSAPHSRRRNISWNWVSSGCIQLGRLENFPIEHMAIGRCRFIKSEALKIQQFQWNFVKGKKIEWSATIKSILHLNIAPSRGFLFRWNRTIEIKYKSRSQNKCRKFVMDYQLIFWSKTRGTYARKGRKHTPTLPPPQPTHRILQCSENLKMNPLCSPLVLCTC